MVTEKQAKSEPANSWSWAQDLFGHFKVDRAWAATGICLALHFDNQAMPSKVGVNDRPQTETAEVPTVPIPVPVCG